ncbi:MAG: GNAT family N-acetyltransferase [Ignavibacteriae bacterium]|nr:GNAT family N-acetyltransferase [Ignavibacteriota bacterium]
MGTAVITGTIRPLLRSDREPILRLIRATGVFSDEETAIAAELIDIVLDRPDQKDYEIAVYDEGAGPLGYTCIGPTPGTEGTFDLYWIAVDPALHGRGIGRELDLHVERSVRERNGRLIVAETSSTPRYDATRMFYQRRGYAELSRIADYYRPGDDLVVYGRYLVSQQGV